MKHKAKIFFLWGVLFFCISFFGMNTEKRGAKNRKQKIETMLNGDNLVWNLVTGYYLDHDSICSFAVTSKNNKQLMLDLALQRKKLKVLPTNYIETLHHKYTGSYYFAHRPANKGLQLVSQVFNKGHYQTIESPLLNDSSCLGIKPCLFFNKEGVLSFYSFGGIYLKSDNCLAHQPYVEGIIRYDFNGEALRCVLSTKNTQELVTRLDMFFSYPYLLKAILNSTHVNGTSAMKKREKCLEFMLEGVILPSNYKEYYTDYSAPSFFSSLSSGSKETIYSTFESFPKNIRKPIEEHYALQHNKEIENNQKM